MGDYYNDAMVEYGVNIRSLPGSNVHGANMGPIRDRQDLDGPHIGPMNFGIYIFLYHRTKHFLPCNDLFNIDRSALVSIMVNVDFIKYNWYVHVFRVWCICF